MTWAEILGPGATMIELRRTRVDQFHETDGLVTMHELADAYARWTEEGDGAMLHSMIRPVEDALSEIKSVVIGDAASGRDVPRGPALPYREY